MTATDALHVIANLAILSPKEAAAALLNGLASLVEQYHRAKESGDETAARHAREDIEWFINNPAWRRK